MRTRTVLNQENRPGMCQFPATAIAYRSLSLDQPALAFHDPATYGQVSFWMNRMTESHLQLAGEPLRIGRHDRLRHRFIERSRHHSTMDDSIEAGVFGTGVPVCPYAPGLNNSVGDVQPDRILPAARKAACFDGSTTVSFRFIASFGECIHVLLLGLGRTEKFRTLSRAGGEKTSEGL